MTKQNDWYPTWTCTKCAEAAGGRMPDGHLATWHLGTCDVCNQDTAVTEPRDFRYPRYDKTRISEKGNGSLPAE